MIPTEHKMRMIEALYRAGVRRMEATAFVSPLAVPQLADAPDILTFAQSLPGPDVQILVPNLRNAESALAAGARHPPFDLIVIKKHTCKHFHLTPKGSDHETDKLGAVTPQGITLTY